MSRLGKYSATLLSLPFLLVITLFFVVPLLLVVMVSFWDYTSYSIVPDFIFTNYEDIFYGCIGKLPDLCTAFSTYLSTLKFVFMTWLITLIIGFLVALFLSFCVRSLPMQVALFLLCTVPFWTSNVIRMISWIPLLGRNGLVNAGLVDTGIINEPLEWLLYSEFAVTVAFVHLYTLFMVVPIFNSMMRIDRSLLEAAYDAGASTWQSRRCQTLQRPTNPWSRRRATLTRGPSIARGAMGTSSRCSSTPRTSSASSQTSRC